MFFYRSTETALDSHAIKLLSGKCVLRCLFGKLLLYRDEIGNNQTAYYSKTNHTKRSILGSILDSTTKGAHVKKHSN